jgi:hypothetical protein
LVYLNKALNWRPRTKLAIPAPTRGQVAAWNETTTAKWRTDPKRRALIKAGFVRNGQAPTGPAGTYVMFKAREAESAKKAAEQGHLSLAEKRKKKKAQGAAAEEQEVGSLENELGNKQYQTLFSRLTMNLGETRATLEEESVDCALGEIPPGDYTHDGGEGEEQE